MKKISLFFAGILLMFLTANLLAQLPQHYNYNTNGTNNSFPFNIAGGKMVQSLYLPADFNQPTPAPSGMITHFWFRVADTYPLAHTYTNLYIRMGRTNLTSLPTGSFYAGTMDTVFKRANHTITQAGGTWYQFTLDTPFQYYNDSSLVIEVGQCSVNPGTGFSICYTTLTGNRRSYNTTGCPYVYSGQGAQAYHYGINVSQAPTSMPNYLYYKFENNPAGGTTVLNCAIPGVGTSPSPIAAVTLTTGGQFDTCLTGTGLTASGVTTGWNCNLGSSSWTISMWLTIPSTNSGAALYLFGDVGSGSFRCFHNGVALQDNLVLRGGFTDVPVTGIGPAPTVVTFVYDSSAAQVRAYKNGTLANTVAQTLNIVTGTGFKVGGYSTSPSLMGKMDEFRLWRRALTPAEVTAYALSDLGGCGITAIGNNNNNESPSSYALYQNYPNPFNPVTSIEFAIPKNELVELKVFDMLGREVTTLINKQMNAGTYSVNFDASSLSSGVYFYTLKTAGFTETKKMMLVK